MYVLLGFTGLLTDLILSTLQVTTVRFGFVDAKPYVVLMGIFSLLSFFSYLILFSVNHTNMRRAVLLCSGMVTILIGLTQLNCNPLPNVLLIVSDATRADHLSLYGYNRQFGYPLCSSI